MKATWIPAFAALITALLIVQHPALGNALLSSSPPDHALRATATQAGLITVTAAPTNLIRITITPVPTSKPILTPIWPWPTVAFTPVAHIYAPFTRRN
jgi:hypothetical protein